MQVFENSAIKTVDVARVPVYVAKESWTSREGKEMEIWQWVLVGLAILVTWYPAGAMGIRLISCAFGPPDNSQTKSFAPQPYWFGWIFVATGVIVVLFAAVFCLMWTIVVPTIDFFNGGIPAWRATRKEAAGVISRFDP